MAQSIESGSRAFGRAAGAQVSRCWLEQKAAALSSFLPSKSACASSKEPDPDTARTQLHTARSTPSTSLPINANNVLGGGKHQRNDDRGTQLQPPPPPPRQQLLPSDGAGPLALLSAAQAKALV
jgi:hypothetical protein